MKGKLLKYGMAVIAGFSICLFMILSSTSIKNTMEEHHDIQHSETHQELQEKPVLKADLQQGPSSYSLNDGECERWAPSSKRFRDKECQQRLPQAMIVGVKKSGTGTLRRYIAFHPAVRMVKDATPYPGWYNLTSEDLEVWRRQMQFSTPRQLTMTENPGYLTNPLESMLRLKARLHQGTKVIVIIRDPVDRSISDYVHWLVVLNRKGVIKLPKSPDEKLHVKGKGSFLRATFQQTVLNAENGTVKDNAVVVSFGRYVEGLRKLATVYGQQNVLILDGAAFIKDPLTVMLQLEWFLNLPHFFTREHFHLNPETGFYCVSMPAGTRPQCANPKIKGRPHPVIDEKTLSILRDYFRPYNRQLAEEFNLSFPWLFL